MNTVKLIVYGTLMSGERNHRFCRNAVSITPCTVTGTLYDTGYGFPAFAPAVIVYSRNLQRFMLQYLKARQKSIPKDISFFAYGVENTDAFFDSASWDIKELVIQAAQMLLTFPQKTEKKIFPVFLHNGESISYQNNKEDK